MIRDKNLSLKCKRVFRDAKYMNGMLSGTGQGAGAPVAAAHSVAASEQTVAQVGAAGDEFYDFWAIPWDMDRDKPLRWRPVFSHSTTTADTPTWKFDYMCIADGEAIADITSHETTTISGAVDTTANALEVWAWTATSSNSYLADADYGILFRLEADDLGGASANEIELFGVELEYTVKMCDDLNIRHTTDNEPVS